MSSPWTVISSQPLPPDDSSAPPPPPPVSGKRGDGWDVVSSQPLPRVPGMEKLGGQPPPPPPPPIPQGLQSAPPPPPPPPASSFDWGRIGRGIATPPAREYVTNALTYGDHPDHQRALDEIAKNPKIPGILGVPQDLVNSAAGQPPPGLMRAKDVAPPSGAPPLPRGLPTPTDYQPGNELPEDDPGDAAPYWDTQANNAKAQRYNQQLAAWRQRNNLTTAGALPGQAAPAKPQPQIQTDQPQPTRPSLIPTRRTPESQVMGPMAPESDWQVAKDWAEKPLIAPEDIDEAFPFLVGPFAVQKGFMKGAAGMTSPENAAIMAATSGLGAAAQGAKGLSAAGLRAASTGLSVLFGSQAGKQLLDKYPEIKKRWAAGDWQGVLEMGGGSLIDAATVAGSMLHAAGEGVEGRRAVSDAIDAHNAGAAELVEQDRQAGLETPAASDIERKANAGVRMNRAERRGQNLPPEEGIPEGVSRGVDARERVSQRVMGKPFAELGNSDRNAIDELVTEGWTGAETEPPPPPRANSSSNAPPDPGWQVVSSKPLPGRSAAAPVIPEAPNTLGIQLQQLAGGGRRVVMFPKGTDLQKQPKGMKSYTDADGNTYIYNPALTTQPEIDRAIAGNRLPDLLGATAGGMGAPDKSAIAPPAVAVVARDSQGDTVQGTVTDRQNLPETVQQAEKLTPPGGDVSVENPRDELAHRMSEQQGGQELTRGTSDIPITEEGQQQAQKLGTDFARRGGLDKIYHGPLNRTVETAQAIAAAQGNQPPLIPIEGLRPWALGDLEGKPQQETKGTVDGLMKQTPDAVPPGQGPLSDYPGESHNQFVEQLGTAFRPILEDYERDPEQRIGVVTHSRDLRALRAMFDAGYPRTLDVDKRALDTPVPEPGQVVRLSKTPEGEWTMREGDLSGNGPLEPGIWIARHGETEWNEGGAETASKTSVAEQPQSVDNLQPNAASPRGADKGGAEQNGPKRSAQTASEGSIIDGNAIRGSGIDGTGQSGAVLEPRQPSHGQGIGKATRVRIPGENRAFEARYAVRELDDVYASHNPFNFEANPDYQHRNDRDYSNPKNAERIVQQAKTFDPEYLVTDAPDAVNGPPVIDSNGNVLGGNSRTMTLGRVYEQFPQAASQYRLELMRNAERFGLDPEQVAGMRRPVLVRELAGPVDVQRAITDLNKTGTAALTPAERALADSRRLSENTLDFVQARIEKQGAEGTLAQALEGPAGAEIVNRLVDDGVITPQEKPQYTDERGVLTAEGKQRISRLLIGRLFRDSEQFEGTAPSLRNNLERVVGPMVRLQGRPDWDLAETTRQALDAIQEARAHGVNLDDLISQAGLFGEASKYSPEAIQVAKKLLEGPRKAADAFRQYAADEQLSRPGAPATFFEPPSRKESFDSAFGDGQPAISASRVPKLSEGPRSAFVRNASNDYHARRMRFEEHQLEGEDRLKSIAYVTNPSGIEYIGRAAGWDRDQAGASIQGMHFSPSDAGKFARVFREAATRYGPGLRPDRSGAPPADLVKLASIAEAAERENRHVAIVVDHAGLPDQSKLTALREELDHAMQARLGGAGAKEHISRGAAEALVADPAGALAARNLRRRGYPLDSPGEAAAEIGVRLMRANGFHELGISIAQARSLAARYVRLLREEHGSEAPRRIAERIFEALGRPARRGEAEPGTLPDGARPEGGGRPPDGAGPDLSSYRPDDGAVRQRQPLYSEGGDAARNSEAAPGAGQPDLPRPGVSRPESPLGRFLNEEAGTSRVGDLFQQSIGEMRELKAKRDAALEELERSKITPEEKKFGQRVVEYFTGERDLWSVRINQALDKLRRIVPDPVDQEALSLMREFTHRPAELQAFLDGKHLAYVHMDPAEYATAMKRIEQMRPAIEKALNPTPEMLQADGVLTSIANYTLREGQRLGILDSRWTPEEYVTHLLHPKGEGELPEPVADRVARQMGGKIGKYFAYAERRADPYPTLLHAVIDNVKPKTLNAFDAFTIHADKFATARATHLLEGQLEGTGVGVYGAKRSAPQGWVPLAPHAEEFRRSLSADDPATGGKVWSEQRLFVPKFVEKALRPITDPDYTSYIPGFRKTRFFQAYTKAIQLGLSLFHATTENYMALANMGPTGWAKALGADRDSHEFIQGERDMVAHGGTSAIQGKTVEAYQSLQPGIIPTWSDIWRRAPVVKQMDHAAKLLTDFTFGNLQRRFKVTDYSLKVASWMADHPNAQPAEINRAKQSLAKEVNAVYGGLHWENLGVNRAGLEMARALMMAPDWTFSNFFNVKYAMERGTAGGKAARMFWIRSVLGGMAATQGLSLALTGKPSKRLTQVYMGTDDNGNDIYQNVFFKGAAGDLTNLVNNVSDYGAVQGIARSLAGKAAPLVRTGIQLIGNRNYLGQEIVPRGSGPLMGTAKGALAAAKSLAPMPLSVGNLHDMLFGPNAGNYTKPEFFTTAVAGNPPQHVSPESARNWWPSSLERGMSDYFANSAPRFGPLSERNRVKGNLTKLVRGGRFQDALQLANSAIAAGKITDDDVDHAIDRAQGNALTANFKRLPLDVALDLVGGASAEERTQVIPLLEQKLSREFDRKAPNEQRGILQKLIELKLLSPEGAREFGASQ